MTTPTAPETATDTPSPSSVTSPKPESENPRSTGRDRRGIQSRAALLKAARKLFSERGFEGTSVGEIADDAGLRKASVFHYFATKDDIYNEVMTQIFTELAEAVGKTVIRPGTYTERLDSLSDAITYYFSQHPTAAKLLLRLVLEGSKNSPSLSPERLNTALAILQAAQAFLDDGIKSNEFRNLDTRHLLLSIVGLHVTYFAIDSLADPFLGGSIVSPDHAKARLSAVREQVHALVVLPHSNTPEP